MAEYNFRLTIPIPHSPVYGYPRGLVFKSWLPTSNEIRFTEETAEGRIWFDSTCIPRHQELLDELMPGLRFIPEDPGGLTPLLRSPTLLNNAYQVRYMKMDLLLKNVSDNLRPYMLTKNEASPPPGPSELYTELQKVARRLYEASLKYANRLISAFRVYLGHFWLAEYARNQESPWLFDITDIVLSTFQPHILVDGEWHPWQKPVIGATLMLGMSGGTAVLAESDWPKIVSVVQGNERPDLVLELLATADLLATLGRRRSALMEACTALEVAIKRFADKFDRRPEVRARLSGIYGDASGNLRDKIERLGISYTLRLLLPLLLPLEDVPRERLATAATAMDERNSVAHREQRDIKPEKLLPLLRAIRALCLDLVRITGDEARNALWRLSQGGH